jgi:hypothetical protein
MLDICSMYGELHKVVLNSNMTGCSVVSKYECYKPSMYLNELWVNQIKYLGVLFNVRSHLTVDARCLKTKILCCDEFCLNQKSMC